MDFRDRKLTPQDLAQLHEFIIDRRLGYQPFIFTDTLEVGEGLKFLDGENAGREAYWQDADPRAADIVVKDEDRAHFRECNSGLRVIYEHFINTLVSQLGGDISKLSFAEVGCNTGYFLHGLATRGAARTIGFDFTLNDEVFQWFNRVLGTKTEFHWAEWDSLNHKLQYAEVPEVDVSLSVAVTCHLADPLHHLAYLCDRSRRAVFVWVPVNSDPDLSLSFGQPGKYPNSLDFPICFDNEVRLSVPLLRLTLEEAGFGDIREVEAPPLSAEWRNWYGSQMGYIAFRTSAKKTALAPTGGGKARRDMPGNHPDLVRKSARAQRRADLKSLPIRLKWKFRKAQAYTMLGILIGLKKVIGTRNYGSLKAWWRSR